MAINNPASQKPNIATSADIVRNHDRIFRVYAGPFAMAALAGFEAFVLFADAPLGVQLAGTDRGIVTIFLSVIAVIELMIAPRRIILTRNDLIVRSRVRSTSWPLRSVYAVEQPRLAVGLRVVSSVGSQFVNGPIRDVGALLSAISEHWPEIQIRSVTR